MRVRSGETPGFPVVKPPCVVERPGAKRGGINWPVRSESEARSVVMGVREFLDGLAAQLREKSYRPQPLRRVHIPKPGKPGQTRPLGMPAIRHRVIMAAAKGVLEPIFEAHFSPVSFGFRPKRSAHMAP